MESADPQDVIPLRAAPSSLVLPCVSPAMADLGEEVYGRIIIVGKGGKPDIEFPLDKKSILIGR